ncbi:MAG: electron transfer flavoprotein subunit beta/FixA family protein [Clostridiales bacterium]
MNIIVCIKQVPDTSNVDINKETNTLIRNGIGSTINPFDVYAVEEGLKIKEKLGGNLTTISMGIKSAEKQLKETTALGVDNTVLLNDKLFAGSDTLATAYILSMGIKKLKTYDLIICGKQAIDGDTGHIGPSLAEKLNIPHLTCVKKIEEFNEKFLICQRMTENGYDVVKMYLPALITVVKDINKPRFPTLKGKMKARNSASTIWDAYDILANREKCGLIGSPTKVLTTYIPKRKSKVEFINGTPKEQAQKLLDKLRISKK